MHLMIHPSGTLRCVYDEAIDLAAIGTLMISRASHVEPDECGRWFADLSPVGGPSMGPFEQRSQALTAEQRWLDQHWLGAGTQAVG